VVLILLVIFLSAISVNFGSGDSSADLLLVCCARPPISKRLSRFLREVLQSGEEDMDEKGFRDYCAKRKFGEETIQLYIENVKEFAEFLKKKGKKDLSDASSSDVKGFVADLRAR
jgi:hypothetical protein